jgi:hypothetical protein
MKFTEEKKPEINFYEEETKRYSKMFNRSFKHLKCLLEMVLHSSTLPEDELFRSSLILDMGIETIHLPRNINIFHGQGLQFVVEVFTNVQGQISSTLDRQLQDGKDESREQDDDSASKYMKKIKKLSTQRSKNSTIIISGGHYENVINEYKEQYNTLEAWNSESISVYACASIFYLHHILTVLQKSESKKNLLSADVMKRNQLENSSNLSSFSVHSEHLQSVRLKVLVLSSQQYINFSNPTNIGPQRTASLSPMNIPTLRPSSGGSNAVAFTTSTSKSKQTQQHTPVLPIEGDSYLISYGLNYKPFALNSVIKVLELLRSHGISASGYLSQLQGYNLSTGSVFDFCKSLNISHLIIVDEKNETNPENDVVTVHVSFLSVSQSIFN